MKVVVAPQALKGSLSAVAVGEAIARGVAAAVPAAQVDVVPVADGGEGTVRALVGATGGVLHSATVTGPLGTPVEAEYGVLDAAAGRIGVIEMASASGLPLVSAARRDPRVATTFGTGELIRAALDEGCRELLIGIGGSATNDGGAGMAQALGARLVDAAGCELPRGGAALAHLDRIDASELDARLRDTRVRVACDVTNPLCGPTGASAVYGPQKGASPAMVAELDAALAHFALIVHRDLSVAVADLPGAGAAGGLGAGLLAFAHAELVPGALLVLEVLDFARHVSGAALVITAEGRLDAQTAYGKAVAAVARAAQRADARVIALAGSIAASAEELAVLGVDSAVPLPDGPLSLEESMARAAELVERATRRALQLVVLGQGLKARQ
jgi:glycerate kinase